MTSKKYDWGGDSLPQIENHSLCKHKIIKDYLIKYICVRYRGNIPYPNSSFKLTIIDGFAGGGQYDYHGTTVGGSPLAILEAVKEAEAILITKHGKDRVRLDVDIICIDKNKYAVKHLNNTLDQTEYPREKIRVWNQEFGNTLPEIIQFIKYKSNSRGKCLFILDQYGYSDVLMSQLRTIIAMNAEVILTFAIDTFITFLSEKSKPVLKNMGFSDSKATRILALNNHTENCRAKIELIFSEHIKQHSNAKFYTPFLIHSDKSNWGYWLVHLSKHYKARDVMMDVHWKHGNKIAHYGGPGLDMLSYKSAFDNDYTDQIVLSKEYRFDEIAKAESMAVLPEQIARVVHKCPLPFHELKDQISNNTPASDEMIRSALWEGKENKELIISRQKKDRIKDTDIIKSPPQSFFSFSRNKG